MLPPAPLIRTFSPPRRCRPPEEMQRFQSPDGNGGGFLVGAVGRHLCQHPFHRSGLFGQADGLRIGPHAETRGSENPVTRPEPGYRLARRFDLTGQLHPRYGHPGWLSQAHEHPHRQREIEGELQGTKLAVPGGDGRCVDADPHFVLPGDGRLHLSELENIRRAVVCPEYRFHRQSPCSTVSYRFFCALPRTKPRTESPSTRNFAWPISTSENPEASMIGISSRKSCVSMPPNNV